MGYSQPSAVSDLSGFAGDNGTISTPNLDRSAQPARAGSANCPGSQPLRLLCTLVAPPPDLTILSARRFAAEGVAFTSWYSAFHVCSPSRAAMMTGRLSVRAGIGFVGDGSNGVFTAEAVGYLPSNETTIAELLKPAGYATYAVGKW